MKSLLILFLAIAATSASVLYYDPKTLYAPVPVRQTVITAPVRTQYHAQDELGQYSYGYAHEGGTYKMEAKSLDGTVVGQYGYNAPDGQRIEISYKANDRDGFVATGDVIPKSVEVPAMVPLDSSYYYVEPEKSEVFKPEKDTSYDKPDKVESVTEEDSGYKPVTGVGESTPVKAEDPYKPVKMEDDKHEVPYIPPKEKVEESKYLYEAGRKEIPYIHFVSPFVPQPHFIPLRAIPVKNEVIPKVHSGLKSIYTHSVPYVAHYPIHYVPAPVPVHTVKVEEPKLEKKEDVPPPSLSKRY